MNKIQIDIAAQVLHEGGVIAYPTESVFGLGCDPQNESAIRHLLSIKKRAVKQGLILIASNLDQLTPYIAPLDERLLKQVSETWPGPTTWLLPAGDESTYFLRGAHPLQAVRISNHPIVKNLCNKFGGAIVSTSANVTGKPAAKTTVQVLLRFNKQIDYILSGKVGGLKKPCEIRNGLSKEIVRPGN
ncbi:MAG: Sua5/YciO/YrdC/YwlC family protein [Gammaproteobacteria bacterium]|nr:Sua5/YciO/YrdC/YwlC family protein [Gammaproteobacteria bacterium]